MLSTKQLMVTIDVWCCQTINRIQNKSFCSHSISVCTVYIYYVYIKTQPCMYIFNTNMLRLNIKYIYMNINIYM